MTFENACDPTFPLQEICVQNRKNIQFFVAQHDHHPRRGSACSANHGVNQLVSLLNESLQRKEIRHSKRHKKQSTRCCPKHDETRSHTQCYNVSKSQCEHRCAREI